MKIRIPGYDTDTRGNQLLKWEQRTMPGVPTHLYVCAPADMISAQVEKYLPDTAEKVELTDEDYRQDWTHAWEFDGELPSDAAEMIDVLMGVLTLRHPRDMLSIALDFYNNPVETDDGETAWTHTAAGSMVYRGKHLTNPVVNDEARTEMAEKLADVIGRHPVLRNADAIISVPGHITTEWRPGEVVAVRTANLAGIPFFRTTANRPVRPEAKGDGERVDLSEEFEVALPSDSRRVLIVDDVLKSGATMNAVRLAAKRAGAEFVYGLVCARTRRKQ